MCADESHGVFLVFGGVFGDADEAGFALAQGDEIGAAGIDDEVALPVTERRARADVGRPVMDRHPCRNGCFARLAATRPGSLGFRFP